MADSLEPQASAVMTNDSQTVSRKGVTRRDWLSPLTGVSEVFLQNNAITGVFFLVGIIVASPLMGAGAVVAVLIATLTAYLFRLDREQIRDGIYGFNATLIGIALLFYHAPTWSTWLIIIVASVVSVFVTWAMRKFIPFPTYTFPFVLTTWIALYIANEEFKIPRAVTSAGEDRLDAASAIVEGVSEVMFQGSMLTGALFVIGLLICSWPSAFWAVFGSFLGMILALWHHDPASKLSLGLYGYNGALAAIALAMYRRSIVLPVAAAFVTIPIVEQFPLLGLEALTAPFVFAAWFIILLVTLERLFFGRERNKEANG